MFICDFASRKGAIPTAGMASSIVQTRLGGSSNWWESTVKEPEALAVELTGTEAALFALPGTAAKVAAVLARCARGGDPNVEEIAHICNSEGWSVSAPAGATPWVVNGRNGVLSSDYVKASIKGSAGLALALSQLFRLESTESASGGSVISSANSVAVHRVARKAAALRHLEATGLFKAGDCLGLPVTEFRPHVGSVSFSLCKGRRCAVDAIRQADRLAASDIAVCEDPNVVYRRDHELEQTSSRERTNIDESPVLMARYQPKDDWRAATIDPFATVIQPIQKAA